MSKSQSAYENLKNTAENSPVWSKVFFILFLFGLPGGLIGTVKEGIGVYQYFTKEDESEFKIKVNVLNTRKTPIDLNYLCTFSLKENYVNSYIEHNYAAGQYLQLYSAKKLGTNSFHILPGQSRDYVVNFPNGPKEQEIMRRGSAAVGLSVIAVQGGGEVGYINFDRDTIRKQKANVIFK